MFNQWEAKTNLVQMVCAIVLLAILAMPMTALAQADESEQLAQAKQRIAQLEQQIRVLQAKLNLLEAQAKNQGEAKSTSSTPPVPPEAGTPPGAPSAPNGKVQSDTKPSTSPEGSRPARKFRMLNQPLQLLPANLRPRMGQGWDSFKRDEAKLWFKETYSGDDEFDGRLTIKIARLSPIQRTVGGIRVQVYPIIVRFKAPSFQYIGIEFEPMDFTETIYVNAESAKGYEKLDPEIPLRVTGKLSKYVAAMKYMSETGGAITWELDDWKIHSPHLPD